MARKMRLGIVLMAVVLGTFMSGFVFTADAQKKRKSEEEIQAEIQRLEQEKAKKQQKRNEEIEKTRPQGQDLNQIIDRYEKLLYQCQYAGKKTDRCADFMYTLGNLYYDQAKDSTSREYDKAKDEYVKEYDKAIEKRKAYDSDSARILLEQIVQRFPNSPHVSKIQSEILSKLPKPPTIPESPSSYSKSQKMYWQLIREYPNSPHVSDAHFRLGNLAFDNGNFNKAYEYLKKVNRNEIDSTSWELIHYRLGECAYYMEDFDKAVEYFHGYVEECDKGAYRKKEFREEALNYMATAFSEMPNSVDKAKKFFKKNKGKSYETQVIYKIGEEKKMTRTTVYGKDSTYIGRSRVSIQRVVMQNIISLKDAYNKRLLGKPSLNGKITVKFTINEYGKVILAQVMESTIYDSELESTVVEKVKSWNFDKIDKPGYVTEVVYPFVFSQ